MNSFRSKAKQAKYIVYFVMRSLLITIFCFMSLICFIFLLYFGDLLLSTNKGTYKNPLFAAYVIVSPSMVPTIKINDAIIVKRVSDDKYKIGDVITFESKDINYNGKTVTHRIVDKKQYTSKESLYTTKGDNNKVIDASRVKTDAIYGKVIFKIPAVGKLSVIASSPANFFISLLIPTILLIIYDMTRIFVMMSKRKI